LIAAAKQNTCAPGGEDTRDFETDAGIGARNDEGLAGLVRNIGFGEALSFRHGGFFQMKVQMAAWGFDGSTVPQASSSSYAHSPRDRSRMARTWPLAVIRLHETVGSMAGL
jgi:hypothetical protein